MSSSDALALARQQLAERNVSAALRAASYAVSVGAPADECDALQWECYMLLGDFGRAWLYSDAIAERAGAERLTPAMLQGLRVILRCLHGFGDAIQFIRYAPLLRAHTSELIVEAAPQMVQVLSGADGVNRVITWGKGAPATPPAYDLALEVMDLPYLFRSTAATLPARLPYLRATQHRARCPAFPRLQAQPKVGLSWASSQWNPLRSLHLGELAPLLALLPQPCYALQWTQERQQVRELALDSRLCVASEYLGPIEEAAVLLDELDLVIAVDGMVAHLAAALGRRVWLLLPYQADWRWGLGDTTPWYPGMRIFRQPAPGDWAAVVERLCLAWKQEAHDQQRAA